MARTPEPEHFFRAMSAVGVPDDVRALLITQASITGMGSPS
jgi:hypothetical protein